MPISPRGEPKNETPRAPDGRECAVAGRLRRRAAARSRDSRSGPARQLPVRPRGACRHCAGPAFVCRRSRLRYAGGAGARVVTHARRSRGPDRAGPRRGRPRGGRAPARRGRRSFGHRYADQSQFLRRKPADRGEFGDRTRVLCGQSDHALGSRPVRPPTRAGARGTGAGGCCRCQRTCGAQRAAGRNCRDGDRLAHAAGARGGSAQRSGLGGGTGAARRCARARGHCTRFRPRACRKLLRQFAEPPRRAGKRTRAAAGPPGHAHRAGRGAGPQRAGAG